jgi:bacillithiol biosynthesis deacetylase BshB1
MNASLDLLIFGAHPDDAEIGMGATIAKHTASGSRVGICDLTRAELSSNGDVETREKEAMKAAEILGIHMRSNLQLPDRGLTIQSDHVTKIVTEIRKHQPKCVCIPYWKDRHPDHVACSLLMQEAIFNAKLRKYAPDIPAWTVPHVIYYFINDLDDADLVVDVSAHYYKKQQALYAYATQFTSPETHEQYVATAINQGFVDQITSRDHLLGQKHHVQYAEAFVMKQPLLVERLDTWKN